MFCGMAVSLVVGCSRAAADRLFGQLFADVRAAKSTAAVATPAKSVDYRRLREAAWLVPWAVMASLLGLVDLVERVVPTRPARAATTLTFALLVASSASTGQWAALARGVACAVAAWSVFAVWAVIAPQSLGFGDARIVCLVALGAGALSPGGTFVAVSCSLLVGAAWGQVGHRSRKCEPGAERKGVALGPLLVLSGLGVAVASAL